MNGISEEDWGTLELLGIRHPEVLALIAALEGLSTTNEHMIAYARKAEAALEAKTAEVDDFETRLSEFLCEMTGGKLSKTGYDVRTMVTHAEEENQRWIEEAVKEAERERDEARAEWTTVMRELTADPGHKAAKYWKWWQREQARADRAEAALERVRGLHERGSCIACDGGADCPTIQAIEGAVDA